MTIPPKRSPTVAQSAKASHKRGSPSVVAWTAPKDMDKPTWVMAGRRLGALGRVSNWLIGDWVREGVARWGERYAEASKITGFDPHSLRNMAYVASRFDSSLRRDNLTWSHHALIAALELKHQVYWLDRAAELKWSVSDLRTMMRTESRAGASTHPTVATSTHPAVAGVPANANANAERHSAGAHPSQREPAQDAAACAATRVVQCPHCGEALHLSSRFLNPTSLVPRREQAKLRAVPTDS
jgi:hypothetical protein